VACDEVPARRRRRGQQTEKGSLVGVTHIGAAGKDARYEVGEAVRV
jgi:hypothetical protein